MRSELMDLLELGNANDGQSGTSKADSLGFLCGSSYMTLYAGISESIKVTNLDER